MKTRIVLVSMVILSVACATPQSHRKKGDSFYSMEQYGQALTEYNLAADAYQQDRDFLMRLAQTYWKISKLAECQQTIMAVLSLEEDDLEALRLLADVYFVGHVFDLLPETYRKIMKYDPTNPIAYNNLGLLYQKMRKPMDAEELFLEAIKVDRSYPDAYLNLGNLYAQDLKDGDTAYYFYRQFLKLAPESGLVPQVGNWLRDYDLAHTGENKRALSLERYFEGETYLQAADFEKSLELYRAALDLWPDSKFMFRCAFVEKELGQYEESRKHFLAALSKEQNNTEYMYQLGWVYKLLGDKEKARQQWELVLRYTPDDERARKALATL